MRADLYCQGLNCLYNTQQDIYLQRTGYNKKCVKYNKPKSVIMNNGIREDAIIISYQG